MHRLLARALPHLVCKIAVDSLSVLELSGEKNRPVNLLDDGQAATLLSRGLHLPWWGRFPRPRRFIDRGTSKSLPNNPRAVLGDHRCQRNHR